MTDEEYQAEQDRHDAAIAATLARWTCWFGAAVGLYTAAMMLIVWVL